MPSIDVVTERVESAAAELAGVSRALTGAGAWMPATAGAAQGTEAAHAHDALLESLNRALAGHAAAADGLSAAVAKAAACYRAADVLPTRR